MEIKQIIVAVVKTDGDDDNKDQVPLYVKIIIFCFMLLILVMDIPSNVQYVSLPIIAFCCVMIIFLEWARKFYLKIAIKAK